MAVAVVQQSIDYDDDDNLCPLCVEEMDLSDMNFLPCPCGYRVCMWCWHHIRENLNGLCPACRTPYHADPHAFSAVDRQDIIKKNRELRAKEKELKKREIVSGPPPLPLARPPLMTAPIPSVMGNGGVQHQQQMQQERQLALQQQQPAIGGASPRPTPASQIDRRHLHNYRVVQRNLVYVIGLPPSCSSEEKLRGPDYFGQYGKISKIVVHRSHSGPSASCSAYVTFTYKEDAKASIHVLEGFWLEGHVLRASFGTSKYCNNFIRGLPCNNPDCVYLHELGNDEDRFTKAEIQAGQSKLVQVPGPNQVLATGMGGPSGSGKRPAGDPTLPAPVFIQDVPLKGGAGPAAATPAATSQQEASSPRGGPAPRPGAGAAAPSWGSDTSDGGPSDARSPTTAHAAAAGGGRAPLTRQEKTAEAFRLRAEAEARNNSSSSSMAGPLAPLWPQSRPDLHQQLQAACFNGLGRCAVFTVPSSSLSGNSIWSVILTASSQPGSLDTNPYSSCPAPFSELLDLTLPPVDAMAIQGWPRHDAMYVQAYAQAQAQAQAQARALQPQQGGGLAALAAIAPGATISRGVSK